MKKAKAKKTKEKNFYKKVFSFETEGGQSVEVTLSHSEEEIQVPVRYQDGVQVLMHEDEPFIIPKMRKFRQTVERDGKKKREVVTQPVKVQGCRVQLRFPDGKVIQARSCCKPPDVFSSTTGFLSALARIFKLDMGVSLNRFVAAHIGKVCVSKSEGKKEYKAVWVKGGKPVVDEKAKPRLSGVDRLKLKSLVSRNGRPEKVKKVKTETETQTTKTAVG